VRAFRDVSFLILTSSLISPMAFASRAGSLPRADGPEVAMEITTRDFGDVFDGEELEQNFPVRNAGTKPLEFSPKSSLSRAETNSTDNLTAAVWHPGSEYTTRLVAAMRAAPS
jgi:hypothetical protein